MSNQLFITQDGSHSIFSEQFGVSYHSKYGAIQETQHVFINAGLRYKALLYRELSILDIGFGTGLNAYMTLLEGVKRNLTIHYTAYEAFPLPLEQANTLNYANMLGIEDVSHFAQLHATPWGEPTAIHKDCLLYTSPSPRDLSTSRMPSSA